jgi:hypothetical protein
MQLMGGKERKGMEKKGAKQTFLSLQQALSFRFLSKSKSLFLLP